MLTPGRSTMIPVSGSGRVRRPSLLVSRRHAPILETLVRPFDITVYLILMCSYFRADRL